MSARTQPLGNGILIAVLLYVVASLTLAATPVPALWGMNVLYYLPFEWSVIVGCMELLLVASALIGIKKMQAVSDRGIDPRSISLWGMIAMAVCAGILFYLVRIPEALLGDATQFSGDLSRYVILDQPVPLYHEPLTMLMISRLTKFMVMNRSTRDVFLGYRLAGAAFGALYVLTSLKIAASIAGARGTRVIAFVLLMTTGGVVMFFGYVENYAPQFAVDLLYVALMMHMFRGKGSPLLPAAVLLLACAFHYQNVLLIPSYVVGVFMHRAAQRESRGMAGETKRVGARLYTFVPIVVVLLLAGYAYVQWKPIAAPTSPDNPFIGFLPNAATAYSLFSVPHLLDIVNEHALLAGVACLVLVVVIFPSRKSVQWTAPPVVFLTSAILFLEAFLVGGNFGYGLARDWDVIASLGVFLAMLAVIALEDMLRGAWLPPRTILALCGVAIAVAVSWIAVNVNSESEVRRYESLVETYNGVVSPAATRFGYENLRKMYFHRQDWDHEIVLDVAMLDVLPWHLDLLRAMTLPAPPAGPSAGLRARSLETMIRRLNVTASDSTLSEENSGDEQSVRIAPPHAGDARSLGDLMEFIAVELNQMLHRWSTEQALAFADSLTLLHPALPYGPELRGWLLMLNGRREEAGTWLRRIIATDSTRARPLAQMGSYYNLVGNDDSARILARKSLAVDPGYTGAIQLLGSTFLGKQFSDVDQADLALLLRSSRLCLSQAADRRLSDALIAEMRQMEQYVSGFVRE